MKHALCLLSSMALACAAFSVSAQSTAPDVAVAVTGPAELESGRPDRFRLSVTNLGNQVATSVSTVMIFPPGVELDTRLNTATGRQDPKVPVNCSYAVLPSKRLTCLANNVAAGGSDTRSYNIDLRAPANGATIANFTWVASTVGDNNLANNSITHSTTFGNFAPNVGLAFPATLTYWVTMGRKTLLEGPMTRPSGTWAVDANGEGSGGMGVPVTWKATKVGSGLSIQINSAMYAPAVDMNLTPLNSRCFQGLGYWTGLRDSYEVRVCY